MTICGSVGSILEDLEELKDMLEEPRLKKRIDFIIVEVKKIHNAGKRMEDRLRRYKKGIERLGFKRIYK